MLELKNIVKTYETGDTVVSALAGVSLCFRENEFVSILGASGCGKTTLLNIVGGLDRYTDGDLIINGKSTKFFRDKDWDAYRNHSIGFVFQSYNLIPHQTVLANVELALTLSGISKAERRKRATEALKNVGLGDQLHKKPNQMSGGQMQRVAIARALVNNPDILLADEPTGALDTQTSVQIMELLKEVAKDRLVIMVTHNPELAQEYSTRIVKLSDGQVIGDSNPIGDDEYEQLVAKDTKAIIESKKDKKAQKAAKKAAKKASMSFATAISLSFKNLLTKKGRTIMTSFAGSIGIIGIALILSLSNGIQLFIDQVQEDALSTYPLSVQRETSNLDAMMNAMTEVDDEDTSKRDSGKIYVDDSMGKLVNAMMSTTTNNLEKFKAYIDANPNKIRPYVNDIQYTYDLNLQVFNIEPIVEKDENGNEVQTGENRVTQLGLGTMLENMGEKFAGLSSLAGSSGMMDVMSEMIDNRELLEQQYDVIEGHWPEAENEIVLVVSKDNKMSRMTLYMLGILDQGELEEIMEQLFTPGGKYEPEDGGNLTFEFDDFVGKKFYLVNSSDFFKKGESEKDVYYVKDDEGNVVSGPHPIWKDVRLDPVYDAEDFISDKKEDGTLTNSENSIELKISGIIRPRLDATATSISTPLAYSRKLTDKILAMNAESEIIKQQHETEDYNVLTGLKFERTKYTPENINELVDKIDDATMEQFYAYMTKMILENEEFADRIKVTKDSFLGMFMLMPAEQQAQILDGVLNAAVAKNGESVDLLFKGISMMTGGIEVNKDNFIRLLPSLDTMHVMAALGIPEGMKAPDGTELTASPGLTDFAGEEAMTAIYTEMTEGIKHMTVNEEIFVKLLGTMTSDDSDFKQLEEALYNMAPQTDATLKKTLEEIGDAQKASPASINFYAKDFESKEKIEQFIEDYNKTVKEEDKIEYTDLIGLLMSSVSIIIDVISYVLIAFVSISLVVSSIMIGIITNISVLERTKEIGILRAIGASKKDISRVFNAETFIIGLAAGIIGIITTLLLCIPTNAIIQGLTGFENIKAVLPWVGGIVLVVISMLLTIIAGLIPSKKASKKDPVIALRSE